MAKYKVIALSVGGLGKKIFNSGDIVTDKNFPAGNAEKLVKQGFLEEIQEKKEPVKEDKEDKKKK